MILLLLLAIYLPQITSGVKCSAGSLTLCVRVPFTLFPYSLCYFKISSLTFMCKYLRLLRSFEKLCPVFLKKVNQVNQDRKKVCLLSYTKCWNNVEVILDSQN